MREYEPTTAPTSQPHAAPPWWALRDQPDLSLTLGHGADAPDPADLGQPEAVSARLRSHVEQRISRRRALVAGAVGLSTAAVGAGGAAAAGPGRGRHGGHPWRGDADALNDALDVDYLREVTEAVTGFGDTPMGWRPGGSPANLEAVDWIAAEMKAVGMKSVATLPVPIDRWVFNGASVAVDGGSTFEASSWGGVPGTPPAASTPRSSISARAGPPTTRASTPPARSCSSTGSSATSGSIATAIRPRWKAPSR